jgi:RNA polymerase sigma factor (sigma-70 family)
MDDLIQAGNVGLVEALDTYDPTKETRFSTHAYWRIRARVIRFVVYNKSLVRIKRGECERLFYHIPATAAELVKDGIDPTPEKIAEVLDADPIQVAEIQALISQGAVSSLNRKAGHDESSPEKIDLVADSNSLSGETVEKVQWNYHVTDRIREALESMRLSERDLQIGLHRFSTDPVDVRTLGKALGCAIGGSES